MENKIKIFYNGFKVNGGKLQRFFVSLGGQKDPETISVYARDYAGFSKEIHEAFEVQNDTDTMTDYFAKDRLYIKTDNPLYFEFKKAVEKTQSRMEMRIKKTKLYLRKRGDFSC